MAKRVTNREFAEKDKEFRRLCEKAGVEPTKRQASKYHQLKGAAFKAGVEEKRLKATGTVNGNDDESCDT